MAIARSVAQGRFAAKYRRIESRRNREVILIAALEFISAVSTALALIDMAPLLGIGVSVALVFTPASLVFFGLLSVAVVCGVLCGAYILFDSINKRNAELNLMEECRQLTEKQTSKREEFKALLVQLLKVSNDENIRRIYDELKDDNIEDSIKEVNGYIKNLMQEDFPELIRRPKVKEFKQDNLRPLHKTNWLGHVIAFFSGAGFMMGICASVIGAAALPVLLLTPVGWAVLAAAVASMLLAGGLMAYIDYTQRQHQQQHMEALETEKHELFASNKRIEKTMNRIESYAAVLSLKPKPERLLSDEKDDDELVDKSAFEVVKQSLPSNENDRFVLMDDIKPLIGVGPGSVNSF